MEVVNWWEKDGIRYRILKHDLLPFVYYVQKRIAVLRWHYLVSWRGKRKIFRSPEDGEAYINNTNEKHWKP